MGSQGGYHGIPGGVPMGSHGVTLGPHGPFGTMGPQGLDPWRTRNLVGSSEFFNLKKNCVILALGLAKQPGGAQGSPSEPRGPRGCG